MEQEIKGKVQKINDEDYEIIKEIESQGLVYAVQWYMENYDSGVIDARETITRIKNKYGVKKELYWPDEDELYLYIKHMVKHFEETGEYDDFQAMKKWYMEASGCDLSQAIAPCSGAINTYIKRNGLEGKTIYGTKKAGCVITILVAITTTLSIGSLIAYYI